MYSKLDDGSVQEFAEQLREFHKRTKALQQLAAQLGTREDNDSLRRRIGKEREAAKETAQRLAQLTKMRPSERVERQRHEKLAADFRTVMEEYEKVTQDTLQKERRIHTAMRDSMQVSESDRPASVRQTSEFQVLGEFDETVLRARQEEIEALERDLKDTNALFKDVSELVHEQGISLDKIEEHADVAQAETGNAVEQLERAEVYQKRARGKLCWIIVAVLALCIVVAAIVLGVKFI